ncbi:hypothetical protein Ddc_08106 [Ditylenchus destructor]|nr:hypothetical protein Ddc_08106 [Ditylenchus destructor]
MWSSSTQQVPGSDSSTALMNIPSTSAPNLAAAGPPALSSAPLPQTTSIVTNTTQQQNGYIVGTGDGGVALADEMQALVDEMHTHQCASCGHLEYDRVISGEWSERYAYNSAVKNITARIIIDKRLSQSK